MAQLMAIEFNDFHNFHTKNLQQAISEFPPRSLTYWPISWGNCQTPNSWQAPWPAVQVEHHLDLTLERCGRTDVMCSNPRSPGKAGKRIVKDVKRCKRWYKYQTPCQLQGEQHVLRILFEISVEGNSNKKTKKTRKQENKKTRTRTTIPTRTARTTRTTRRERRTRGTKGQDKQEQEQQPKT